MIWRIDLEDSATPHGEARALLSADERDRADRFRAERAKLEFVRSHAALRIALGRAVGADPAELVFRVGEHGKPYLDPLGGVDFSLSHTRGSAIIGVCSGGRIGVDVERRAVPDHLAIAQRWFAADEVRWLEPLPVSERERRFLECWTRKEAYVKALGVGLAGDLKACLCHPGPNGAECRIDDSKRQWRLVPLDRAEAPACALVDFEPARIEILDFRWSE